MRIIPAIDIIDGKCVRLTGGDYGSQKIYNEHPLEVGKMFEDAGIRYVHLVDLDGAKARRVVNYSVLEQLASQTSMNIDFGGGLNSEEDVQLAFNSGAVQVSIGSVAVRNPNLMLAWLDRFGPDRIILGADCRNRMIATSGWTEDTSEEVLSFIGRYEQQGVRYSIVTDIEKDGRLMGPSLELYKEIIAATEVSLIASGGITSVQDLMQLKALGCEAAIVGKALYEGNIKLYQLKDLC